VSGILGEVIHRLALGAGAGACWRSRLSAVHTEELSALARRQHGVFGRWQARDLGFTRYAMARRLDAGEWRVVMGSVYTAGSSALGPYGRIWAGYLAAGPGAVLSGPSAVTRHGLDVAHDAVWATVPPERNVSVRGLRTIRESLPAKDVLELGGMRVTTASRSILDCLRVLPRRLAEPLLDRALLRGWVTVDAIADRAMELTGRRGVTNLRAHLTRVRSGARSEAERLAQSILMSAGIDGWIANYEIRDADGIVRAVLDLAFEVEKLAVEIDGLAHHSGPDQFQRDRTRQNWLINLGWKVLRFTWDDLTKRPHYVIATILAALQEQDPTHR